MKTEGKRKHSLNELPSMTFDVKWKYDKTYSVLHKKQSDHFHFIHNTRKNVCYDMS